MHWSFNSDEPGLDCAVHKVFPWPWLQRDYNHRRWLCSRSHVRRWDRYLKRNICLTEVVSFCHTCLPHAGSESNPLNKGARASAGTCKEYTTQSGAGGNTGNVQKVCCDNIRLKNSVCRWAESVFLLGVLLRHEWSKEHSGLFSPTAVKEKCILENKPTFPPAHLYSKCNQTPDRQAGLQDGY